MKAFVARRGPWPVFVARFVPGGALHRGASSRGPRLRSLVLLANVAGLCSTSFVVCAGWRLGDVFRRLREQSHVVGEVERTVLSWCWWASCPGRAPIVQAVRQRTTD